MRVFVTYAFDNKQHVKDVIAMCKALKQNGFSVSVDEPEGSKGMQPTDKQERHALLMDRYHKVGYNSPFSYDHREIHKVPTFSLLIYRDTTMWVMILPSR